MKKMLLNVIMVVMVLCLASCVATPYATSTSYVTKPTYIYPSLPYSYHKQTYVYYAKPYYKPQRVSRPPQQPKPTPRPHNHRPSKRR